MNLTKNKKQLNELGITPHEIEEYISKIQSGPKPIQLQRACVIGDGIIVIDKEEKMRLIKAYSQLITGKKISGFIPASGAATRMFKHLYTPENNKELVHEFIHNLEQFAFYDELKKKLPFLDVATRDEIIEKVLDSQGLNYGRLPKALIDFHRYEEGVRKSIDEQLVEGVSYVSGNGVSSFHFTISPEHQELVHERLEALRNSYEKQLNTKFDFSFSTQQKSTDTISLDENNEVLTDDQGALIFRPGGHGALIHNLNKINSDVVFIKNIDNITIQNYHEEVVSYKKMLGAYLIQLQNTVFEMLHELDNENASNARLEEMSSFLTNNLNQTVLPNKADIVKTLNRPIRVCGMVKNEGKAGGGPFWVKNTVQIVESAQMDSNNPKTQEIVSGATHFNPVDLVCGLKNYKGEKFDLLEFVDDETFFVSSKTYGEKNIKVLEHPGLWNGAMAHWLTVFVEVPVSTFHPVKTVNDLLQPAHRY